MNNTNKILRCQLILCCYTVPSLNISLSGIDNVVVYPKGYFPYEFNMNGFLITVNLYVIKSLAYDILLGYDVISKLNLAIDENGIKIVGKRKNVQVGYIEVLENSNIKLNYAARCNNEMKASSLDDSRDENIIVSNDNNARENFLINVASVIYDDEIDFNHVRNLKRRKEINKLVKECRW